ncbi:MAG TPA: hypothetical protein VFW98_01670 [Gemmatimonadaceae bacterium]|nr:hypothetical protein [Gemmatimonadaceae bacterium]
MKWLAVLLAVVLLLAPAGRAVAQVAPNAHWETIRTEHFKVHFTPALEDAARRAAADAEQAYAALSRTLDPPRGPIDLVVADNLDVSNGFTTVFPSNRIVIYTHPPLDVPFLRFYDDWIALVITHELTHVFHLDRADGWWGVAQHVFGRAPWLFPNAYSPGWITEGLATYFESAITGAGRVNGTHERMLLRASVEGGGLPRLDEWSLATTRYPGGDMAYAFGSLFFEHLAQEHGRASVGDFVDRSSHAIIPFFLLDHDAKQSFGISFEDAWHAWRDSLAERAAVVRAPLAGWRDLTHRGRLAGYPRWRDSTALVYAASPWITTPGAYRVDTAGDVQRLGRRNGTDVNAPGPDGTLVFAQLEYVDPYHVRSDLYLQRGQRVQRLTHGARLSEPDVRRDGWIVAVQSAPATTQLVRVSPDGARIVPITPAALDTEWAEPRWSPSGDRIAATRWTRGGYADIVVIDTLGHLVREITHDRAFDSSPSWTPDGSAVLFTSDRTGTAQIYIAVLDTTAATSNDDPPRRLSRATLGLFYPTVSADARYLAGVRYEPDGWHVGLAPFDTASAGASPLDSSLERPPLAAAARDTSPAQPYSPWASLVPRYWSPMLGETAMDDYAIGAFTSGSDIVGRHSYYAQALFDPTRGEHSFDATYSYSGFGMPVLSAAGTQYWDRIAIVDTAGRRVGDLHRRTRAASIGATIVRPRFRTYSWASVAGELEWRDYTTSPSPLLSRLPAYYSSGPTYRSLLASAGWSNTQRPVLAVSQENGITVSASGSLRWLEGMSGLQAESMSGVLEAFQAINAGGFSHQVVAARVAAGFSNGADPGEFDLGGTTGTPVSIVPGVTIGSRHTFGVRGFPSGARSGSRVLSGSLEYRAPLFHPSRGLGLLPIFLDRVSIALFGDAGTAWSANPLFGSFADGWLASVGGELNFDTAWQYDIPYRVRLGVAVPVVNHSFLATRAVSVYVRLGAAF